MYLVAAFILDYLAAESMMYTHNGALVCRLQGQHLFLSV